ncbi:hypothetical protein [Aquirufa salirivi]|uniref:Uncharacterized protein n=1 Tax=Aquirufa salirivi TaxID=3104729 RepID=A0ABW8RX42_9BACT
MRSNILFFLLFSFSGFAIPDSTRMAGKVYWNKQKSDNSYTYGVTIIDYTKRPYTMRQFNQNYLSTYRIFSRTINTSLPKKWGYPLFVFNILLAGYYLLPYTHEEGHRSVLTALNIGSVSSPVFSNGVAKVTGVSDETLMHLRDSDLPNYIRLHTAGLESDFSLLQMEEELLMFQKEKLKNIYGEYYIRKLGIVTYMVFSGLGLNKRVHPLESNENDRDIVGDDVLGAVRHMHRPDMPFQRYTSHQELNDNEKTYLKKVAYLSFLNLLSPLFIGKTTLAVNPTLNLGFGAGYVLAPFGDMLEENVYIQKNQIWNVRAFLRQFGNNQRYFWGGGLSLVDYPWKNRLMINATAQCWNQPKGLDFNTTEGKMGTSLECKLGLLIPTKKSSPLQWISLDLTLRAKTQGFVPQDPYIGDAFNMALGMSIYTK